jgi:pyruvate-formate lyase-activating enzyme
VLDTLVYLRHETDVWFEITTLLIPGHNDSDAEIAEECAWLAEHLGPTYRCTSAPSIPTSRCATCHRPRRPP